MSSLDSLRSPSAYQLSELTTLADYPDSHQHHHRCSSVEISRVIAHPTQPSKQYEVFQPGHFQTSKFEIRQNGHTILTTKRRDRAGGFKSPYIHIMSLDGTILAACMLMSWSRNQQLYLGSNPDHADKSECTLMDCEGFKGLISFTGGKYKFVFHGQELAWTRTHSKALGASRWDDRTFKLVDQNTRQVLAVFRFNNAIFQHRKLTEIDYYVELEHQLEMMSSAAILGIQLYIVKMKRACGSGAAGAGGILQGVGVE
ncbi:hypothetical protein LTR37_015069 [Vermiconidia calcicola]|uniref:Uncharacterized protein n=1 Tax=Vermiconidia calcicola TaxID=1690605 RepID=A0ACC3MRJ6_9PEZI|nr:hypothetical protein LTR37_015069 [Vermiconidia calcicola]